MGRALRFESDEESSELIDCKSLILKIRMIG
jgi:hypothetical protein